MMKLIEASREIAKRDRICGWCWEKFDNHTPNCITLRYTLDRADRNYREMNENEKRQNYLRHYPQST